MSQFREFIKQMPYVCESKEPAKVSWILDKVYTAQVNKDPVWQRNENDEIYPGSTIELLFGLIQASPKNLDKKQYCFNLVLLTNLCHLRIKHGIYQYELLENNIKSAVKIYEGKFSDVDKYYTIEMALEGFWDD